MQCRLLLVLLILNVSPAFAQNWNEEERGLIDAIEACWARAATERSPESLEQACGVTAATTYWWTPETAPFFVESAWVRDMRAGRDRQVVAQDLRPIRIQMVGDFGFIWYHGIRSWQRADGQREIESWRGFEVFQRTSNGWSFFGGMGTPDVEES